MLDGSMLGGWTLLQYDLRSMQFLFDWNLHAVCRGNELWQRQSVLGRRLRSRLLDQWQLPIERDRQSEQRLPDLRSEQISDRVVEQRRCPGIVWGVRRNCELYEPGAGIVQQDPIDLLSGCRLRWIWHRDKVYVGMHGPRRLCRQCR